MLCAGGLFAVMCRTDRVGKATLSLHYKSLIVTINRQGYWSIHLSLITFDCCIFETTIPILDVYPKRLCLPFRYAGRP